MGLRPSLQGVARTAGVVAALSGLAGVLSMLGAFGPIYCRTERMASSDGTSAVSRTCGSGIDYLLGNGGGNAATFFAWAMVLLAVVVVGVGAVWTGRRRLLWGTALVGTVVSVIGLMSIGWYFVLPTACLLLAATALTGRARRARDDDRSASA